LDVYASNITNNNFTNFDIPNNNFANCWYAKTLNDVQTGLSNAAGFVSTQAQSAGTAVVNTAKSASKLLLMLLSNT